MTKVRGIYCLKKNEVIRGYSSFKNILTDSKVFTIGLLKINIQVKKEISDTRNNKIYKDPLENVKVGFVVSKRSVKKASLRNKLKRLLREAYRLNKYIFVINNKYLVYLLFSYNGVYEDSFKILKFKDVNENMRVILIKAIDFLKKYN